MVATLFRNGWQLCTGICKDLLKTAKKITEAYSSIDFELINQAANIQKSISAAIKSYLPEYKLLNEVKKTAESFYKTVLETFHSAIKSKEENEKYAAIMIKSNWPPVIDFAWDVPRMIIEAYETTEFSEFRIELDNALLKFYDDEKIKEKLISWRDESFLNDRIHILEEIINSFLNGKFFLVVPVMLIQIEGLLGDYFNHIGRMTGNDVTNYLQSIDGKYLGSMYDAVKKHLSDYIYANFEWGSPITSFLSRHTILHGADKNYGTKMNAIKSILLFDFLVHICKIEKEINK